jgi:hypothetical protein
MSTQTFCWPIKASVLTAYPSQEYSKAHRCENLVAPEGIRDDGWFAEMLLTADPIDEHRDESESYYEQNNVGGVAD